MAKLAIRNSPSTTKTPLALKILGGVFVTLAIFSGASAIVGWSALEHSNTTQDWSNHLCAKENNYKESTQHKLLEHLQAMRKFSVYHYTTKLGRRILEKDDDWVWPLAGIDYEYDI